jgi:peptidoglycan glycosyltransferase
MRRRDAISLLFGTAVARGAESLAGFFEADNGSAILIDIQSRRIIAAHNTPAAEGFQAPPGSTVKPFVLAALLKAGKLTASESYLCPGTLTIAGRSFNCSHPPVSAPMRVDTALAYSCNCFIAHVAERFEPRELAPALQAAGLAQFSGRIVPARNSDAVRMQALGEDGIVVTVSGLAMAYRGLALHAPEAIISGLEEAVDFGTAQRAQVAGGKVAGKTGSVRAATGARIAWFTGFVPSRAPEAAIAVMLQGRSGGSDAAPIAGRILQAYRAGKL